ncbi:VPS10 domain-containing protein [Bizionia paragorgiae]|uniref:VPS10 domain-containing protein n=1 Tax=Bizionia paragorgiae TaxID=283786 RepID=UPI003A92D41A
MKKFIFILSILCMASISQNVNAQFEITGSEDYGRIFDLTYDPNIQDRVYALTLSTHLLVSEDNAQTFEILYSLPATEGVRLENLKIDTTGEKLTFSVYNGKSEINKIVIFDLNTQTIEKNIYLPNSFDLAWVNSYSFYSSDYNYLLMDTIWQVGAANYGKTFYTTDGGDTWTEVYYTENYDTVFLWNVAISPYNPNKLFLMRGNGETSVDGGIFISDNGGQTWTEKLAGITNYPIAFHPTNPNEILLGSYIPSGRHDENIYKSTDAGETWDIIPIQWTPGILDCINVIKYNPSDPNNIIVLEENEILVSNDGANTFNIYPYPAEDVHSYYFGLNASYNPTNNNEILISNNWHPLKSNDGGATVNWIQNPFFTSTDRVVYSEIDTNENLYYGVQFGYIHRNLSTNIENPYEILPLNYVSTDPGTTLYADKYIPEKVFIFKGGFMGSTLELSNDNGATKTLLYSTFLNYCTAVASYPTNNNEMLAAFSDFNANQVELVKFNFEDPQNPSTVIINLPETGVINAIVIDETDSDMFTLSVGNKIYRTLDGGNNWTHLTTGVLVSDLKQNPLNSNQWAIATGEGVLLSNDNGQTWNNVWPEDVFSIKFSNKTNGHIIALTYHNGNSTGITSYFNIHATSDGGTNWHTITNEQLESIGSRSADCKFTDDSAIIYIGTDDLGLVEYTLEFDLLSIPSHLGNEQVVLYPVPTENELNVKIFNQEPGKITIYNLQGLKVVETTTNNQPISVGNLLPGTYLAKIEINNKTFFKRFIKN